MGILVSFLRGIVSLVLFAAAVTSCDRYGIYRGKTGKI